MKNYKNIFNTIGNTPLIKINGIYAKLETTNPTGSVKDRMAWYIVRQAEKRGELKKGDEILEVTSGNTGIAFAMISAVRGYRFTAVMPESMSEERKKMMRNFGAKLILTPAKDDVSGAVKKYEELAEKMNNVWLPKQFENPDNILAHQKGLGQEIIKQMNGNVDAVVAGAGTGGTLLGIAKALKGVGSKARIFILEPNESAVLSGGQPGLHKIQGIGEGFIPKLIQDNMNLIDGIIRIKSEDAIRAKNMLTKKYGLLIGISSGANYLAGKKLSKKYKRVVTVFADRGERYLS